MNRRLAVAAGIAGLLAVSLAMMLAPDTGGRATAPPPKRAPAIEVQAAQPASNPQARTEPSPSPQVERAATPAPAPKTPPNALSVEELEASMALPADLQVAIGTWDDHQLRPERLDHIEEVLGHSLSVEQRRELVGLFTAQSDQSARLIAEFRMQRVDADEAADIIHDDLTDYRDQVISITGLGPDDYNEIFAPLE